MRRLKKMILATTLAALCSGALQADFKYGNLEIPKKSSAQIRNELLNAIGSSQRIVHLKNFPSQSTARSLVPNLVIEALAKAQKRGVQVVILQEATDENFPLIDVGFEYGIPVMVQKKFHGDIKSAGVQYAIVDDVVYVISEQGQNSRRVRDKDDVRKFMRDYANSMGIVQAQKEDEDFFDFD